MGAGGSADAMKFSDVLILVGIGILCAGFIIHGWVETTPISNEDDNPYEKSVHLLKGDELNIVVMCDEGSSIGTCCGGELTIIKDGEVSSQLDFQITADENLEEYFKADEYGEYKVEISLDSGSGAVDVDVKRALMLDFIIYPIGAAVLIYGLQKRRAEMNNGSVDAELEL